MVQLIRSAAARGHPIDIVCLGTPLVIGDAVGPLVGSLLLRLGLPGNVQVIGCLSKPVTQSTYITRSHGFREDALVISVDAAIGKTTGVVEVAEGPLKPGAAVPTEARPIGDISIRCYMGEALQELHTCEEEFVKGMAVQATTWIAGLVRSV